jgi:hypothetical protein
MAKASTINKRIMAKKDMNFFAEFTANAAKAARMLGYGVAIGFLVVAVVLGLIVAFFIRNQIIKGQINDMKELLAGPNYASLEAEAQQLTEELNKKTNYFFALTQMRKAVDLIDAAPTDLPEIIEKCIPSDSYVSTYTITSSQLTLEGTSFTYYSPIDMVNMLNQKNVFTGRPAITVGRVDPVATGLMDTMIEGDKINVINNYYNFVISGTLVTNVHISITRYVDGADDATSLGGVQIVDVRAGESYTISEGVAEYEYAGVKYTLTRIYVDGIQVEDSSFATYKDENRFTDVARGNTDVKFYYTPVTADATEG